MGGTNPYIEQAKYTPATKKFKVTFLREGKTVEVDPEKFPYGHDGLPGSLLDIATGLPHGSRPRLRRSLRLLDLPRDRARGAGIVQRSHDAELDQLDEAPGLTAKSRLGCQCVPDGIDGHGRGDPGVESSNFAKEARALAPKRGGS